METTKFVEEMKKQTIGVEIEMAEITRNEAARVIAGYFRTLDTLKHINDHYDSWTVLDNKGRTWKVSRDVSIKSRSDLRKTEVITPILTYDDINDLQEITRALRKKGAISNPNHMCGVHIHIGVGNHNAHTLRNLANIMASKEDLLIGALNLDTARIDRYCKMVDQAFLARINKRKPSTMEALKDLWYNGYDGSRSHYNSTRYHMLNFHSVFSKGTIEFRLFQFDNPSGDKKGGLHAGQLKSYIQLCLALSELALTQKSASAKIIQRENKKYAMRTWLLRLCFIGAEFKTARDLFTERLEGCTAFRYGRPINEISEQRV